MSNPTKADDLHDRWAEVSRKYAPPSTWDERGRATTRRALDGDPRYYASSPWSLMPRWLRGQLRHAEQRSGRLPDHEAQARHHLTLPEGARYWPKSQAAAPSHPVQTDAPKAECHCCGARTCGLCPYAYEFGTTDVPCCDDCAMECAAAI